MVREEHKDIMMVMAKKAADHKDVLGAEPFWSMDNDSAHITRDQMAEININPACRLPLTPKSPDIHKVIEHEVHRVKDVTKDEVGKHPELHTAREMQALTRKVFYQGMAESVLRDCISLLDTLKAVALPQGFVMHSHTGAPHAGTGGDWAPTGLR